MKKFKSLSEAEEALNIDYVLKSGNSEDFVTTLNLQGL